MNTVGLCRLRARETHPYWVYDPKSSIPVWVARVAHDLGRGLEVSGTAVDIGDVFVCCDDGVALLSELEFANQFEIMAVSHDQEKEEEGGSQNSEEANASEAESNQTQGS